MSILPPFRPALLAFDMDGTLIPDQEKHLSGETAGILAQLRASGVKLAIITGRDQVSESLRLTGHLHADAANNGGLIHVNGQLQHAETLAEQDVTALLAHGLPRMAGAPYPAALVFTRFGHAVMPGDEPNAEWMEQYRVNYLTPAHRQAAYKVLYSHPDAAAYANHLRATQPHLVVTGGLEPYLSFVSVTPENATKSIALKRIAAALKVPLELSVAFGDSDNDADLLETAGFAVQVGHHPHLTPHADTQLPEQAELNGYLRRLLQQFQQTP